MVADAICPKLLATWTCTHPRGLSRHLRTVFPFHFSCPDIIRNNWILSDAKCSARQILTMPRVASRIRTLKEHSTVFSEQLMQREVAFWSGFEEKNNFGSRSRKQFRIQRIRIHNAALSPIIYLLGCTPLLKRVAEHVPGLKPHNWRTKIPPSANIQWLSQQLFISNISPYIRAESPIHSAPQYRDSPARIESPFHSAPQCRDSLARIESPFHSAPKYRDSPARIESLFNSAPQYRDSPARIKSLSFCAAFQG